MDRGAWQATVHGVTRVGHDLVTKSPYIYIYIYVCIYPMITMNLVFSFLKSI